MSPDDAPAALLLTERVWGSPLHAMRSIHALGAPVLVATAGRGSHVFGRSRVRARTIDLDAAAGPAYLDAATTWARSLEPDRPIVVIPFSDRTAEAMHTHRHLLTAPFRPVLAGEAAMGALLDKASSMRVAEQAGLTVPPWRELAGPDDVQRIHDLRPPVVLKPSTWRSSGVVPFKISVHHDPTEAASVASAAIAGGAVLVAQEYRTVPVEAVEFALTWTSDDGSRSAVCAGRKCRQSAPEGGVMSWGVTADLPDVDDGARRFIDASGYTGPGGIEFIRTDAGLEFIEFNPRLEAIHFLAAAAGIDIVRLAYDEAATGRRPSHPTVPVDAAAWIGSAWFGRLQQRPGDLRLCIGDRIRFARSPRRERAVLTWRDPAPALAVVADVLSAASRRLTSARRS